MLLISNHGGHSGDFCDHAEGTKAQRIEAYINAGFSHVALTEHLAPPDDRFLFPEEKGLGHNAEFLEKRLDRLFFEFRSELYEKYSNKIQLLIGFETEFCGENPLRYIEDAIERYKPDLVVGSVHHVQDICIDYSKESFQQAVDKAGSIEALYCNYYDQQYELISFLLSYPSSVPMVLGHMDLIRLFSDDYIPSPWVWERIERNLKTAVKAGIVIEVNARAFAKGLSEPYPCLEILKRAKTLGAQITLSDDSHQDSAVGLNYDKLEPLIRPLFDTAIAFEQSPLCRVTLPL